MMRTVLVLRVAALLLAVACGGGPGANPSLALAATFDLTVLHTNDIHARFEQFDGYGGSCSPEESAAGECFGGVARRDTKIKEIRAQEDNVLLLDAGDEFQGTMWFYLYKGDAAAHFMNIMGYDAMAIGNHEFDNRPEGLKQFLLDVNFTVLSCNIDASQEPSINGFFNKSRIFTVGGQKIGVIGYTYSRTPEISATGKLEFSKEIPAIQAEVDKLVADHGVNKIIAVGHSGFSVDLEIAKKVRGLDIVVGGHTNTFLYTGTPPSSEVPEGVYPTVVHPDHDPTRNVLVVTDYTTGKYLGRLNVMFDDDGKITKWEGNPILLDNNVAQDPAVLAEINDWAEGVRNLSNRYVGSSHVLLNGSCRLEECNLGNILADAFVRQEIKFPDEIEWNDVSIALVPGGGIRTSIPQGDITIGDISTIMPFGNTIDTIKIKGIYLMEAFENSVAEYDPVSTPGRFLQFSGVLMTYDLSKKPGSRVVKVEVRCTECKVPAYVPLEMDKVYKVIVPSFLASGGDGYTMIRDNLMEYNTGNLDTSIFSQYIQTMSPLTGGLERRIKFVNSSMMEPCKFVNSSMMEPCKFVNSSMMEPCKFVNSSMMEPCKFVNSSMMEPCKFVNSSMMEPCKFVNSSMMEPCKFVNSSMMEPCKTGSANQIHRKMELWALLTILLNVFLFSHVN